jgi:hypothetical protein
MSWRDRVRALFGSEAGAVADGMDRRSFLRLVSVGSVGLALPVTFDLERALWVPSPRVVVPATVVTGNILVTPEWITREALRILKINLNVSQLINRSYDETFTRGSRPQRYQQAGVRG